MPQSRNSKLKKSDSRKSNAKDEKASAAAPASELASTSMKWQKKNIKMKRKVPSTTDSVERPALRDKKSVQYLPEENKFDISSSKKESRNLKSALKIKKQKLPEPDISSSKESEKLIIQKHKPSSDDKNSSESKS